MSENDKKDLEELKNLKIEVLHKELDLIQGCINRMGNNSFLIKGWWVTSILALLTLKFNSDEIKEYEVLILILGSTFFSWIYNAYFLKLERLYRKKYEWVVKKRKENLKFLYNLDPQNYDMHLNENNENWKDKIKNLLKNFVKYKFLKNFIFLLNAIFSKELIGSYGLCLILLFLYA